MGGGWRCHHKILSPTTRTLHTNNANTRKNEEHGAFLDWAIPQHWKPNSSWSFDFLLSFDSYSIINAPQEYRN